MKCSSRKNYVPPAGLWGGPPGPSSMKCSSRRNCDSWLGCCLRWTICLNEVQFPKELRHEPSAPGPQHREASMKCSSRRNCDRAGACRTGWLTTSLNEVQFPKKLRHLSQDVSGDVQGASMKCSPRRNRDSATTTASHPAATACLNEVQFPKELRPRLWIEVSPLPVGLNEVQFPKELRRPAQYSPPPRPSEEASRALLARTSTQPPRPSPHLTESPLFQRSTAASTARGSSSTGALASGDKRPLWRDRPGQADIGESLFIN